MIIAIIIRLLKQIIVPKALRVQSAHAALLGFSQRYWLVDLHALK